MVDSTPPAPSKSISVMKEKRQQLWQPTTWHQTFPFKLYEMLQYACNSEFRSALSWLAEGNAFIIHDKNVLMNDLAPMFFKQTQFRSFTRQLNIWGFVRTDAFGGETGGWQHEDFLFLRGRPDLLGEIERNGVKSAVIKKSPSISSITTKAKKKASSSSRSATKRAAKSVKKSVVVADETSVSSSSRVEVKSRSSQSSSSFQDDSARVRNTGVVVSAASPVLNAPQGSVFQYFSSVEQSTNNVQDSVSLSSSSSSSAQVASNSTEQQAEPIYRYADTSSDVVRPFDNNDLMYLADLFDRDEHHRSHDEDLCSILSLNQETTVEDLNSVFNL